MKLFVLIIAFLSFNQPNNSIASGTKEAFTTIDEQKFCFDDTHGNSGMITRITLLSNGSALIEFLKDDEVVRKGKATWKESTPLGDNSNVYLTLSNGNRLSFKAVLNLMKNKTMLIDSRDNLYVQCF